MSDTELEDDEKEKEGDNEAGKHEREQARAREYYDQATDVLGKNPLESVRHDRFKQSQKATVDRSLDDRVEKARERRHGQHERVNIPNAPLLARMRK